MERKQAFQIKPADRMTGLPAQFFAALVRKANAQAAKGRDVINLGQGNPDRPTPPHIVEALQQAAPNPLYHKYPPFSGFPFLKEAVARRYKEDYGVELDPEKEVAILFGGKTGLIEISQCLLNPGDVCLVPDPGYPDYWSGVALAGGVMAYMPLKAGNGFLPDYDAVSADAANKAKLMFVNYPNNPTGAQRPDLNFTRKRSSSRRSTASSPRVISPMARSVSTATRLSVSFKRREPRKSASNFTRCPKRTTWPAGAWASRSAIRKSSSLINLMQDHYYCSLFGGIQAAAATALTGPQQCVAELTATYESRRDALFGAMGEIGWESPKPSGSFFCWLPVPKGHTSISFADHVLEHADVVLAPGVGFGTHGEGYVRLGLLAPEERLQEAIHRIGKLHLFG